MDDMTIAVGKDAWQPFRDPPGVVRLEHLLRAEHITRFGGHISLSVGEHCIRTALLAQSMGHQREVVFACLIHDLHEVYPPGDVPAPLKEHPAYAPLVAMEQAAEVAVVLYFGLTILAHKSKSPTIWLSNLRADVRDCDRAQLRREATHFGLIDAQPELWEGVELDDTWSDISSELTPFGLLGQLARFRDLMSEQARRDIAAELARRCGP